MVPRRLSSRSNARCLQCRSRIEGYLKDNEIYECPACGQKHYVDKYTNTVSLTDISHPDLRRRPPGMVTTEQLEARRALIRKKEQREGKKKRKTK